MRVTGKLVVSAAASLLVALFLVPASKAMAYNLEGPVWPGQPTSGCCAHISYRNFAADTKEFNAGTTGANAWNNSTAYVIYQAQSGGLSYEEVDNSSVSWDGLTTYSWYTGGNGKEYFNSDMIIQVNHWWLQSYGAAKAQSVSAHEFGHALGLGHHNVCVLMNHSTPDRYSSSCGYINTPQLDDIRGANDLY